MLKQRTFNIGINETIIDKPVDLKGSAENWQSLNLTEDQFICQIKSGHAFSAHFREGYRKTPNFICSDFIAADVDGNMSIDQAVATPFVRDFASFIYTTPSHSNDRHRFRIVFLLDETICQSGEWKNCLLGLALKLGSDLSIKDAGRMFFGNSRAFVVKIGKLLPKKEVGVLVAAGVDHRSRAGNKLLQRVPMTSSQRFDGDQLVTTSFGTLIPFKDLSKGTSVYCLPTSTLTTAPLWLSRTTDQPEFTA